MVKWGKPKIEKIPVVSISWKVWLKEAELVCSSTGAITAFIRFILGCDWLSEDNDPADDPWPCVTWEAWLLLRLLSCEAFPSRWRSCFLLLTDWCNEWCKLVLLRCEPWCNVWCWLVTLLKVVAMVLPWEEWEDLVDSSLISMMGLQNISKSYNEWRKGPINVHKTWLNWLIEIDSFVTKSETEMQARFYRCFNHWTTKQEPIWDQRWQVLVISWLRLPLRRQTCPVLR